MKSPNYDLEDLVELVMRINELMEVAGVFMLSEMLDIKLVWSLRYCKHFEPR